MSGPLLHPDTSINIFAGVEIARSLTSQFFLYMLANPEINAVMEREFGGDNRHKTKLSLSSNAMPGKNVELAMHDLMTNAKMTDATYNIDFIRRAMSAAIISVHDEIKRRGLEDKEEDLEFLRHIRNACGHGNRFTFKGDEPRRPAKLKQLDIKKECDGVGPVLFEFITPGDVVLLLDTVTRRLDPVVSKIS
jgi:hypothetical protein